MKYRVVDFVVDYLSSKGLNTLFTVTGGGSIFINDAFNIKKDWNCFANHNEQASAFAAEGYSRLNGKPGICVLTSGPGGTNALTGVLCSYQDSIPVIFISGNVRKELTTNYTKLDLRQLGDQECDIVRIVKPITKAAIQLNSSDNLFEILEELYLQCTTGRPGPVWLDIPLDIQQKEIIKYSELITISNVENFKFDTVVIDHVLNLISESNKPLLVLGNGLRGMPQEDLYSVINDLSIPFVTSFNGLDLIDTEHHLNFGRMGVLGQIRSNLIIQECDLLIVLGSRLYVRQIGYNINSFAKNAKIIQVDIDINELEKPTSRVDVKIHSCVIEVLRLINQKSKNQGLNNCKDNWIRKCNSISENNPIILDRHLLDSPINPYGFLYLLSLKLPSSYSYVLSDGTANVAGSQIIHIKKGQRLFTNKATAPMGYGLPAAIGAAIDGDRIICLEGDGSIQMNIQELQTLRQLQLNVIVIILNNNGYVSIRATQNNLCGGRLHLSDPTSGLTLPNYKKLALAFEIEYTSVNSLSEIPRILKKLENQKGPLIIEVMIDEHALHEPKIITKLNEKGEFNNPEYEDISWLDKK
jgi:acetolactate synthase-1/2/3 large subunit